MADKPEATWPLLTTVTRPAGDAPAADPSPAYSDQMVSSRQYAVAGQSPKAAPAGKKESAGSTVAKLAIILAISIPLTAITASELGLRGLLVVWVGIVLVAAFAFLPERFRRP